MNFYPQTVWISEPIFPHLLPQKYFPYESPNIIKSYPHTLWITYPHFPQCRKSKSSISVQAARASSYPHTLWITYPHFPQCRNYLYQQLRGNEQYLQGLFCLIVSLSLSYIHTLEFKTYPHTLWITYPHFPQAVDSAMGIFPHFSKVGRWIDRSKLWKSFVKCAKLWRTSFPGGELSTFVCVKNR